MTKSYWETTVDSRVGKLHQSYFQYSLCFSTSGGLYIGLLRITMILQCLLSHPVALEADGNIHLNLVREKVIHWTRSLYSINPKMAMDGAISFSKIL
mmetsp:Transcript_33193/g.50073  ORF Transcript_33193/g.50073 Transcript_33193/m.50073 type:complete len:97 (-) Transcript_33193:1-291(-)